MRKSIAVCVVVALVTGCGSREKTSPQPAPRDAATGAAPAVSGLRLPDGARPLRYRAALELDPAATSFRGRIEIDVTLARPLDQLTLHADALIIERATWRAGLDTALTATALTGHMVALRGDVPLPAGDATVVIEYTGVQDEAFRHGMRRRSDAGDWYLITQFEALGARRVFPCFDEPGFKVPWQLELIVPAGQSAFSNAGLDAEAALADGRVRHRFRPTQPLPSYLLAIAVGPYDIVDAGPSRHGVPIRIIVPRGRGADAAYAAAETPRILAALEDYTGIPYPYDKLDQIVVPGAPRGAMENAGLITYAPKFLLIPPSESQATRRDFISVCAHELSHQWFGDLVTMAWWDDLWLNEGFADWAETWVLATVHPEMDGDFDLIKHRATALTADSLTSARQIRQPITEEADIGAAFDGITYAKGATVIGMFEQHLGPEVFRQAVRAYLSQHSHGNATSADFLAALDAHAATPVSAAFRSFLDQPGVPRVEMTLRCDPGQPPVLALAQQRHLALGATAPTTASTWQVPVCVRAWTSATGEPTRYCTLLAEPRGELPVGATCPTALVPNAGGVGYYLPEVGADAVAGLLDTAWDRLTPIEQAALLDDVGLLIDGDRLGVAVLLAQARRLGGRRDRHLPHLLLRIVERLARIAPLVADADRPAFARLVRDTLSPTRDRLGWIPGERDTAAQASLRAPLMSLLSVEGQLEAPRDQAVAMAQRWVTHHDVIRASLWTPVLRTAVRAEPATVIPLLVAALATEPERLPRRSIYAALAAAPDPASYQGVLDVVLAADPLTAEMTAALAQPDDVPRQRLRFDWVRGHLDALLAKTPPDLLGALPSWVCDAARRDGVAAFLRDRFARNPEIGELEVAQQTEAMDRCIAERAAIAPQVAGFLSAAPATAPAGPGPAR